MAHDKYTFFEGNVFVNGGSLAIVIPAHCASYLGVMAGDSVDIRILKVKRGKIPPPISEKKPKE